MQAPCLQADLFRPGQRVAVAVSGGADSVALLRRLLAEQSVLGIVLSVVHVHHGIRGQEADADAAFVEELAGAHRLDFHLRRVDAPQAAESRGETLEEAARNLRYACFEELLAAACADAVATAHTLDDQAETVLYKLLRGAWTEGLSGIHPVLPATGGSIVRPFLQAGRAGIEVWLLHLGQPWREDASNSDLTYTRNRVRHQLLPLLKEFNPEIARQLARLAAISADEERYWQRELDRLLPSLLLPGKPVRGGGRSSPTAAGEAPVAIELDRLRQLPAATRRRVLRAAARQLGVRLGFEHTESLMALAAAAAVPRGKKAGLPGGLLAERTPREIRFSRPASPQAPLPGPEYAFSIPGEVSALEFGLRLRAELKEAGDSRPAVLRNWRPGDRVSLRHRRGVKKVTEILDRLGLNGSARQFWPVVESDGKILWMRGVEAESGSVLFTASSLR
jgi:tRNA(Ile)-lysidine synthase